MNEDIVDAYKNPVTEALFMALRVELETEGSPMGAFMYSEDMMNKK